MSEYRDDGVLSLVCFDLLMPVHLNMAINSHHLTLPYLAFPCRSLPCLAMPCLALPCLAMPCLLFVFGNSFLFRLLFLLVCSLWRLTFRCCLPHILLLDFGYVLSARWFLFAFCSISFAFYFRFLLLGGPE